MGNGENMNTMVFGDFETTNMALFKERSDDPNQPHIVQMAAVMVDIGTRKILQSADVIVKPYGWGSCPESLKLHGITDDTAAELGIEEFAAMNIMLELCKGRNRVFYNKGFDNKIGRIATKRYFPPDIQEQWKSGESECSMQLARKVIGGRVPKLEVAYKHFFGADMENAHTAMGDTLASMKVYFAAKDALG